MASAIVCPITLAAAAAIAPGTTRAIPAPARYARYDARAPIGFCTGASGTGAAPRGPNLRLPPAPPITETTGRARELVVVGAGPNVAAGADVCHARRPRRLGARGALRRGLTPHLDE